MKQDDEGAYYAPNENYNGKRHGKQTDLWRIMPPCTLPDGRQIEGRAKLVAFGAKEKPKQGKDAAKPWEHDAWRIVLRAWYPNGRGAAGAVPASLPTFYATDYRTGTGHRVEPCRVGVVGPMFGDNPPKVRQVIGKRTLEDIERMAQAVPNAPEVWEVVHNLCSDASCAHGNTFEDFCSEMGGDTDSISSRETYLACVEIAARLPRFLGVPADNLGKLGQTLDEQACERSRAERETSK